MENNIIDDWLSKNGNHEIEKQVENEAKELMENKIPTDKILTAQEWILDNENNGKHLLDVMDEYANYFAKIQLQSLTDEIKEKAETQMCQDGKGCGVAYCEIHCDSVNIKSIQTITDNFIKQLK